MHIVSHTRFASSAVIQEHRFFGLETSKFMIISIGLRLDTISPATLHNREIQVRSYASGETYPNPATLGVPSLIDG